MIECDRIDVAEGNDLTKNKLISRECWLCGYYYFLDKNFNYEKHLCNGCHDMSIKANSMHNLAIAYNNGSAYRINFVFMSENDALNLIRKVLIIDKRGVLYVLLQIKLLLK